MLPSILALLATASFVSAFDCVNSDWEELVTQVSCGKSQLISKCLRQVNIFSLEQVSPCFVYGGCENKDAVWFMQECTMPAAKQDLGKRATTDDSDDEDESTFTPTAAATSSATKAASTSAITTTKQSAAASSKSASSAAATASSTVSLTSASSTLSTSSVSSTGTASSSSSSTSTTICYTPFTISTYACSKPSGSKGSTCISTTVATSSCVSGLLCFPTNGPNICMKRDVPLTTGGIAVAIVFGAGLLAVIAGLVYVSFQERYQARQNKIHAAMLKDTEEKFGDGFGGESDSNLPLMTGRVPTIKLHPGSDALGQDNSAHWSEDHYSQRS